MRRILGSVGGVLAVVALLPGGGGGRPPAPGGDPTSLVYEVFVRSFADGNGDAKQIGDLKGLRAKLDYLNDGDPATRTDLAAGILWLMPVCPSPSYHGYDVTDFRTINPEYGTLADFKALATDAHARGVRIILDMPFNHTSDDHPWFKDAVNNPASPFRAFYHIVKDDGTRGAPWRPITSTSGEKLVYLGLFSSKMPDLNFDNAKVREEVIAIARFWLDQGADGFRLDAAKHIFGDTFGALREADILANNDWWREFSFAVYKTKPDAVLVGEVLGDPETLRRHSWGLDGLLDEPLMNDLRAHAMGPGAGFVGRRKQFLDAARAVNDTAFQAGLGFPDQKFQSFGFAASHDRNPRLASDLEEAKRRGMPHGVDEAYRLVMYHLLLGSGRPVLYQGDEVMQRGWKWNGNPKDAKQDPGDGSGKFDETLREPFPWKQDDSERTRWLDPFFDKANDGVSVEEQGKAGGMLDLVRGLGQLRARQPALSDGGFGAVLNDTAEWAVFERVRGNDRCLVLINQTADGHDYAFHDGWFPEYRAAKLLFWSDGKAKTWKDETAANKRIAGSAFVPPFGVVVLGKP